MYVRIYMAGIITMYPRYAEKLKIIKDHRNNEWYKYDPN